MSPKQREYIFGERGKAQREAHNVKMTVVFRGRKQGPATCADCRKSECRRQASGWAFVCTIARALTPQTCSDFADSRKPTWEGPILA